MVTEAASDEGGVHGPPTDFPGSLRLRSAHTVIDPEVGVGAVVPSREPRVRSRTLTCHLPVHQLVCGGPETDPDSWFGDPGSHMVPTPRLRL